MSPWSLCTRLVLLLAASICWTAPHQAAARLRSGDLAAEHLVSVREWLSLRLEVMGLRLSYPAYRIHLQVEQDGAILFTFHASSTLAEHLTEQTAGEEAERTLSYHARGIRLQVEAMLETDFPRLWTTYQRAEDFRGLFLGPGSEWDDPPVTIGRWAGDAFTWSR